MFVWERLAVASLVFISLLLEFTEFPWWEDHSNKQTNKQTNTKTIYLFCFMGDTRQDWKILVRLKLKIFEHHSFQAKLPVPAKMSQPIWVARTSTQLAAQHFLSSISYWTSSWTCTLIRVCLFRFFKRRSAAVSFLSLKARSHCSDNENDNNNNAKRTHSIGWMSVCVFCVEQFNQYDTFSLRRDRYNFRYCCSVTRLKANQPL